MKTRRVRVVVGVFQKRLTHLPVENGLDWREVLLPPVVPEAPEVPQSPVHPPPGVRAGPGACLQPRRRRRIEIGLHVENRRRNLVANLVAVAQNRRLQAEEGP